MGFAFMLKHVETKKVFLSTKGLTFPRLRPKVSKCQSLGLTRYCLNWASSLWEENRVLRLAPLKNERCNVGVILAVLHGTPSLLLHPDGSARWSTATKPMRNKTQVFAQGWANLKHAHSQGGFGRRRGRGSQNRLK